MISSETKGLVILCAGLVFIIVSLRIEPYDYPVYKQVLGPLVSSVGHPSVVWVPTTIAVYPLLLPAIILMIIGLLLVVIGVGIMLNLYGKRDYRGD